MPDTVQIEWIKALPNILLALAAVIGAFSGLVIGIRTSRKVDKVDAKADAANIAIEVVRSDVNDKMQQLITTTHDEAYAKGVKSETDKTG